MSDTVENPVSVYVTKEYHDALLAKVERLETEKRHIKERETTLSHRQLVVEDIGRCLVDIGSRNTPEAMGNVAAGLSRAAWRLTHDSMTGWADHTLEVSRLPKYVALWTLLLGLYEARKQALGRLPTSAVGSELDAVEAEFHDAVLAALRGAFDKKAATTGD